MTGSHKKLTLVELLILIVAGTASAVFRAWCLVVIWNWFLTRIGIPSINVPIGYGLVIIASFLNGKSPRDREREGSDGFWGGVTDIIASIINASISLGMGWIALHFL